MLQKNSSASQSNQVILCCETRPENQRRYGENIAEIYAAK